MIRSFVALGDSFTEGLDDPDPSGVGFRGWADRLAEVLAARQAGFRYANLAVRGRLLDQVVADQVPHAVASTPDLVSLCAGGNDLMRPGADPDRLGELMAGAVAGVRATGARVVLFTGVDPRNVPILRRIRPRVILYNDHLRAIGDQHGCLVADLWSLSTLYDWRAWSEDRLHLSAAGHRLVAGYVAELLGVGGGRGEWQQPWPPADPVRWVSRRRADAHWLRAHVLPWVGRRLRGRSSGDGMPPKRPDLSPYP
ncbi:MAG TPA: SGNH/GDSL hydrolase family protein [Actinomycetes bacterium]|nr:SGNH/GDSL hydrolase family protein [Actinomycetes bacterium]